MEQFDEMEAALAGRFKERTKGKMLEERRQREARVVAPADRVRTSGLLHRTAALNQKITPEEKARYAAYAKAAGVSGPDFLTLLLDAWISQHQHGAKP